MNPIIVQSACLVICLVSMSTPSSSSQPGSASVPADITYELTLRDTSPRSIGVTVKAGGADTGQTIFAINAEWGGVTDGGKEIHDVAVQGKDGRILTVERSKDHQWSVTNDPNEPLTFEYTLRQSPDRKPLEQPNDYRPIVTDRLFHMIGNTGLVHPEHLAGDQPRTIRVSWKGFTEAGWNVVSSHGPGADPVTLTMPLDEFRHALFLAGDIRIHEKKLRGGKLGIAIYGTSWKFSDEQFVDLVARIVEVERAFFDDWSDPWYLVSLIPAGPDDPHSLSLGGTGLTNCFALFVSLGATMEHGSHGEQRMKHLLAHEYFHNWNGGRIEFDEPEQQLYWFSEGFTDYYARLLLHRAGLYTTEEYVADWNESLKNYYLSPYRNAPIERVITDFWKNREIGELPYRRGDLLALLIDHQIRKHTNGKKNLDDFMRALLLTDRDTSKKMNNERLFARLVEWTDSAFVQSVQKCVEEGTDVALPADLGLPLMKFARRIARRFDLGFDLETTQQSRKLSGVRPGSAAHEAGLRDGQKLAGWSIQLGDAERPVDVTVEEDGVRRQIKYLPAGDAVETPFFELRPSDQ